jgi:hypothetical protein
MDRKELRDEDHVGLVTEPSRRRAVDEETGDPIKKLDGFDELWEARVRHSTGWYRLFFTFAEIDGDQAAAFDYGLVKQERNAPRHEYKKADRRVRDSSTSATGRKPRCRPMPSKQPLSKKAGGRVARRPKRTGCST